MPNLEPAYLRYIYDGLIKGSIHPENAAELPDGLIGLYEEAFDERTSVIERQKLLQRFAIWALLKKEVSVAFVAEVLGETEDDIQEFISTYSAWFNSPESRKYQLYHERLKVYLLQKMSEGEIQGLHEKLISRLEQAIEEQKSDEFEWYGLEFLGYHLSIHFHLNSDQGIIDKIKYLAENDFIERQISCSGRYNWTFDFYHQAIASFELCDDRFKYDYYYRLLKYQLEEENRVEQIILEIEDFPNDIIFYSIENLGTESLLEKQQQFTAYFNVIFNLLLLESPNIDKLNVLNSKLENCFNQLLINSFERHDSFFPYQLVLLLVAKLNSIGVNADYLFENHDIYYGTINRFEDQSLFKKLKLNPKVFFRFIRALSQRIENKYISFIEKSNSQDTDLDFNPHLNNISHFYWELRVKLLDEIYFKSFDLNYFTEFIDILNRLKTNEIDKLLLSFPFNLDVLLAKKLYNSLESERQFKACYSAINHFILLDNEIKLATIELIINEEIYTPDAIRFLLLTSDETNSVKLNTHFNNYTVYLMKNKFDYNSIYYLFSNCFQLYNSKLFDVVKKVNEQFVSECINSNDESIPYSEHLNLLRFFEKEGGIEQISIIQIIQLKIFELEFLGMDELLKIKNKFLFQNYDLLRSEYMLAREESNDYYSYWEFSLCQLMIKLGHYDLLIQFLPNTYLEHRLELLDEILNVIIEADFANKIHSSFQLDKNKYRLDTDMKFQTFKTSLQTNMLKLSFDDSSETILLLDIKTRKMEISSYRQENYILNFGKTHLAKQEIQLAIDLLPHLMNYQIPSLSFEIGFTIFKMNQNWEEFITCTKELLNFYENQHDTTYKSFNLQVLHKKNELEIIIRIAYEIEVDIKHLVETLMLYFDFSKLPDDLYFYEILSYKDISQEFLEKFIIELIKNDHVHRNPLDQIIILTDLPRYNPTKDTINSLLAIFRENYLEYILLLGLLPQTSQVRNIIKSILKQDSELNLKCERDCVALNYFLKFKFKIKNQILLSYIEDFAKNNKFSIYSYWDEDEGMFVEFPHVKNILGKSTLVRNEVSQFKSENYTELGIWNSDNEEVAIVDDKGFVTAIGIGKATITLTVKGIYCSISNSKSKSIEVIEGKVTETVSERMIHNELSKPVDQINFAPILYKNMKDKHNFRKMIEQHAVYKTYFPDQEENYLELAHELFDLTWMNFTQETN